MMQNTRFLKLGWVVAAAAIGLIAAAGFQPGTTKIGVVDLAEVVENSALGKSNQADFAKMKAAREDMMRFASENRIMTAEQSKRFKELSVKPTITAVEKAELESIKKDVQAAVQKNEQLVLKANLTPEERTLLNEYANRAANMDGILNSWYNQFMQELETWANDKKVDSLKKAREALKEVAAKDAFTVVFEAGVAPYGANDLTDATLKAMDAKK